MDYRITDDSELVRRRQQLGDDDALAELVRRHYTRVQAIVRPIVVKDAATDDVTQEVFVRVLRGIKGFKQSAEFTTWLHRIAVNACYDFLRRESRRSTESLDMSGPGDIAVDTTPSPSEASSEQELSQQIGHALLRLSPKLRAAISLVVLKGLDAAEAAEIEGCATATMHWRVHEARRKLSKILEFPLQREDASRASKQ